MASSPQKVPCLCPQIALEKKLRVDPLVAVLVENATIWVSPSSTHSLSNYKATLALWVARSASLLAGKVSGHRGPLSTGTASGKPVNRARDSNCTVGGLVSCRLLDKGSHISIAFLVRFLFSGDLPGKSRVPSSLVRRSRLPFSSNKELDNMGYWNWLDWDWWLT